MNVHFCLVFKEPHVQTKILEEKARSFLESLATKAALDMAARAEGIVARGNDCKSRRGNRLRFVADNRNNGHRPAVGADFFFNRRRFAEKLVPCECQSAVRRGSDGD